MEIMAVSINVFILDIHLEIYTLLLSHEFVNLATALDQH